MKPFQKAAIIGVGLIGGSLALDLKRKRIARQVVGVSRRRSTIAFALKGGIIDAGSCDIGIAEDADLIIFASPVQVILEQARQLQGKVAQGALVLDVGSTKQTIVATIEKIFPRFVGSHPLAGSEKRGVVSARAGLFEQSLCILTPTARTDAQALSGARQLWRALGCRVQEVSPVQHDTIVAFISHLPHALAFSLIEAVPKRLLRYGASGLKDTTRIAASDAQVWADIFLTNPRFLAALKTFRTSLSRFEQALLRKDRKALVRFLQQASEKRRRLG